MITDMNMATATSNPIERQSKVSQLRVLFVVEGYTDIRFVVGLSEICELSMIVPAKQYRESGLEQRVREAGLKIQVDALPGGRLQYQQRCFRYLWNHVREYDVVLSQEVLRGSFGACLACSARNVPVITYMGIAPVEYFRCRRERRQIGLAKSLAGEWLIKFLMWANGRMATRCLAMGPYLRDIAAKVCPRSEVGLYYGVDTDFFRPADEAERRRLRLKLNLPPDVFLIFLSSRISHEKDPETVLRATSNARQAGLNAVLLNLGGGYKDFIKLAGQLQLPGAERWVLGRPAAHPMTEVGDYFRTADAMALASLAEGAAFSTLETLACGTPLVCSEVGGMAVQLRGYARFAPRQDPETMAKQFLWIAENGQEARAQALRGRDYVLREWNRDKAFSDLLRVFQEVAHTNRGIATP
jgi:glycosyltransferase involved in cell wall biosynthesis